MPEIPVTRYKALHCTRKDEEWGRKRRKSTNIYCVYHGTGTVRSPLFRWPIWMPDPTFHGRWSYPRRGSCQWVYATCPMSVTFSVWEFVMIMTPAWWPRTSLDVQYLGKAVMTFISSGYMWTRRAKSWVRSCSYGGERKFDVRLVIYLFSLGSKSTLLCPLCDTAVGLCQVHFQDSFAKGVLFDDLPVGH